jgi:tripartite ATP-independent transporter DctM subunit
MRSLAIFAIAITALSVLVSHYYGPLLSALENREIKPALDETIVVGLTFGTVVALSLAGLNRLFRLGLLSRIAERVTFVLIPPLALIFLVLGTIFLGVATPTEGGAMGAVGALIMAVGRRKLDFATLRQALESTTKLSVFVLFILIGSTIFSFIFTAVDGQEWVEHLFDQLPGGQLGFLIFVNTVIFFLGFFLDFFEIAFILIPLLAPVADKLGVDLIWFGVMIALNLQTSFLTPPFGFALFYLRSVAPVSAYLDRLTNQRIAGIKTLDIYRGSVAFVAIQVFMIGLLIAFPQLVTGGLDAKVEIDLDTIRIQAPPSDGGGWGDDRTGDPWK